MSTAREKQSEWQPIAEAPKDGTWVLLGGCAYGYEITVGRWWKNWDRINGYTGWADFSSKGFEPTHWQPLPLPPASGD